MYGVAILGAGIGSQHVDGWRAHAGRAHVHWVCDLDADRAGALAARVPGCCVATDIDAVLADTRVHIVCNCLPPHLHASVSIKALRAGRHVVCEKPLATSLDDAERMAAVAAQADRLLVPVFQYRYGPGFSKLDALRAAGVAGEPYTASLELHWDRGRDYYAVPWRGTWAGERGGALLGHAIHLHDLVHRYFDEVAEVSAFTATRVNPIETEDCAALALRTRRGALVTSSVTLGAATDETRLRFVYAGLTAESGRNPYAPAVDAWRFLAREPRAQADVDAVLRSAPAQPASGFAGQFGALLDTLDGLPANLVGADDGVRAIEFVSACYASARSGQRVKLPLAEDAAIRSGWQPAPDE